MKLRTGVSYVRIAIIVTLCVLQFALTFGMPSFGLKIFLHEIQLLHFIYKYIDPHLAVVCIL